MNDFDADVWVTELSLDVTTEKSATMHKHRVNMVTLCKAIYPYLVTYENICQDTIAHMDVVI
jgi:hypothetical protein